MPQIKQVADGGFGLEGKDAGTGPFMLSTKNYNVPVATTAVCLVNAGRAMVIDSIIGRPFVAGTGGAATVVVWKAPSGTAPISGTGMDSTSTRWLPRYTAACMCPAGIGSRRNGAASRAPTLEFAVGKKLS